MRQEFVPIYEAQYTNYGGTTSPTTVGSPAWIRSVIEQAVVDLNLAGRIRIDAKLFLLTNSDMLVMQPLMEAINTQKVSNVNLADVAQAYESDIRMLLTVASAQTAEITGHVVISAADFIWPTLRLLSFDIWSS